MAQRTNVDINIEKLRQELSTLEHELSAQASSAAHTPQYQQMAKRYTSLKEINTLFETYSKLIEQAAQNTAMGQTETDPSFAELVREENERLETEIETLANRLNSLIIPDDEAADKPVIVEIRAGTGGEEAALFAADLYRMYTRFAERKGLTVDAMSSNPTGLGGIKEVIFSIKGKGANKIFRLESGVHRVQRVPVTEASGRIHTSAVTVVAMPEPEDIEITIPAEDIRIDVFRSSGHGGQSVNTTDSAVRITHLPTGMIVQCQDEKSQLKNKAKAMRILKARLLEKKQEEEAARLSAARKDQVKSGDRSEKIRTYNFPQNRVTDHRIGVTIYNLSEILEGELGPLINPLMKWWASENLKSQF